MIARGVKATVGWARGAIGGMADLVLPQTCLACSAAESPHGGLCEACNVKLLSLVALHYCPRCGTTIGPNIPVHPEGCASCPNPLGRFSSVVRLGPYAAPLRQAVLGMKYHGRQTMRGRLEQMLAGALSAARGEYPYDVVIGVAAHWRRRLAQGYDHAGLLARGLGRRMSLPVGRELARTRHTAPQVHLPRSRRIENVRGAFTVRDNRCIEGAHVVLVDDVTTTGATADEATRTLLRSGASRVTLAVIAKSEPPRAYAEAASGG